MCDIQVRFHPINQVVLESTLNDLMQNIWGEQLMDVCTRKIVGERLAGM